MPPRTDAPRPARFRGLPAEARRFFVALDRDPCPDAWPGGDRVAYAAHVLSPLKALAHDLGRFLADVRPRLALESRVGRSLARTATPGAAPADCPVRVLRAWSPDRGPDRLPLLVVEFGGGGLRVGLDAPAGPAPEDARLAADTAALTGRGWTRRGNVDGTWSVERRLGWDAWIDEPGLAEEIADRFRELLPLYDRLVDPAGVRAS